MADNITNPNGDVIRTDDISGVHWQGVKLALGADGSATFVAAGTQADSASVPVAFSTEGKAQLGAVNEAAPGSDTASSGLNGRLQRIAQRLTSLIALVPTALGQGTMAQSLKVAIASDQSTLPVNQASQAYDVQVSVTRPSNTTAYTAGDVMGATAAAITFANAGPNAGAVMITGAQLQLDIASIPSGMTGFQLHFYSVTPPSALADNAVFNLPSGDRNSYLGYIDLGTPVDLGDTCYFEASGYNKQIKLAGTSVFAYLVTLGGYTPASAAVHRITLHTVAV